MNLFFEMISRSISLNTLFMLKFGSGTEKIIKILMNSSTATVLNI